MARLEFSTGGRRWLADLAAPIDLAIKLDFKGKQPSFFATAPASSQPLRVGSFTGSVALGASCNCSVYSLAPHCHGTHTECVGHVTTGDDTHVADVTPVAPSLALLVSVEPVRLGDCPGLHPPQGDASDRCITAAMLAESASRWSGEPWQSLVVRTLPNLPDKRFRSYNEGPCPAPYFLQDAMRWMVERDVRSLVVDLPSLDRADDGGHLAAHRTFWGLAPGAVDARQASRGSALVTELAFIPSTAVDGLYLLDLQVPAFGGDAAPSRPVLYSLSERHEANAT